MNTNVTSITPALLNRKTRCCDSTIEAHPDCRGWFADGWAWHGCKLDPGHPGRHRCTCGREWATNRGHIRRNGRST